MAMVRALKSGHILLASVCAMVLLANLLATASAGLFVHRIQAIPHPALYTPPFQARFVHINGSIGPATNQSPFDKFVNFSGAYVGGVGEDQFLALESNYTRNTSLPSWIDHRAMYLPFRFSTPTVKDPKRTYEARTKYFEVTSNCKPLKINKDYRLMLWDGIPHSRAPTDPSGIPYFDTYVQDSSGGSTTCYAADHAFGDSLGRSSRRPYDRVCWEGRTAAELSASLMANLNASAHERQTCMSVAALGWMRTHHEPCYISHNVTEQGSKFQDANATNTLMVTCQPQIRVGEASVRVDASGLLLEPGRDHKPDVDQSPEALSVYFTNGADYLIAQSNRFLFRSRSSPLHNDTYASEFLHYFMARSAGHLRFTDPAESLPSFEEVRLPLEQAHKALFATWLGVNKELLLLPANKDIAQVAGTTVTLEERLFLVTPMLIIAEAILSTYTVVSLLIYLRRPGRYLPRMPISIAAIVALFASSAAVRDLQGTSHMNNKERERYLQEKRYGYGSYVGSDGAVHVGIEKTPFVQYMDQVTFAGSRVEREVLKQRGKGNDIKAGSQYTYIPISDTEERSM